MGEIYKQIKGWPADNWHEYQTKGALSRFQQMKEAVKNALNCYLDKKNNM